MLCVGYYVESAWGLYKVDRNVPWVGDRNVLCVGYYVDRMLPCLYLKKWAGRCLGLCITRKAPSYIVSMKVR